MKICRLTLICCVVSSGVITPALLPAGPMLMPPVQETPAPPQETAGDWQFEISPYLWLAGTEGDVSVSGLGSANIDISPSDWLDDLDFGGQIMLAARYRGVGLLVDFTYLEYSPSVDTPGPLFSGADITSTNAILNLYGTVRLAEGEWGWVDLLGGARWFYNEADITFKSGLLPRTHINENEDTWNGVGGLRARVNMTDRLFLMLYGDLGAGALDFTWQAGGSLGYAFTDVFSMSLGYRAIGSEDDDGQVSVDTITHGFVAGFGFRF